MIDNLELKKQFFEELDERRKRLFAALEANELGYHGVTIVSKIYGIHPHTVRQGQKELLADQKLSAEQIRNSGGGRKKTSK